MKRFRYASLEGLVATIAASLVSLYQVNGRSDLQYQITRNPETAFILCNGRPGPEAHHFLNNRLREQRYPRPITRVSCESSSESIFDANNVDYIKLNPDHVERTALQDTHALFGALLGDGFIERYDVYRRTFTETTTKNSQHEIVAVDLKVGNRLDGHPKIVHGGIISLLFDEAMGWAAYIGLEHSNSNIDGINTSTNTFLVTANLSIDFRAPFISGSNATLRVYLDQKMTAGRKMYFVARLESEDGKVTFAEARSLFLCVASERMEDMMN